jgi:serine/threonine-protein kinase HipA
MSESELEIWMGDQHVGTLDGTNRRNLKITYSDLWREHVDATPLSISMPLAQRVHSGKGVAAFLWGLLPDNDRVLARWARTYQCSATDVFGLLKGVGSDVAGGARYVVGNERAQPPGFEPLDDGEVAGLLKTVVADASAWHGRTPGRWSLAGAQAKIALAYDDGLQSWGMPSGTQPTTHILKPAIAGLTDHDLNEHVCLSAANLLGLRAAHTRVVSFEDQRVLVVKRYDRLRLRGVIQRVHQEDFCQALGVHPTSKYQAEGGPSVENMTDLLREVEPTNASADVNALVRAVAFNWLILGTDAHAKNYSLLLSGSQVRLAPLYDVASMVTYVKHPRKLKMAQKIGGEYRATSIARRHWERLAKSAHIDSDDLIHDIISMAARLPDAISTLTKQPQLNSSERKATQHLLNSLRPWLVQCEVSMGGGS